MTNNSSPTTSEVDYLLSPKAIRASAARIYQYTIEDRGCFSVDHRQLQPTVDFVVEVVREKYPDLKIPFHSRWGHFRAGGVDRVKILEEKIRHEDPLELARIKLDLVIPSVLLDAGAGNAWNYLEPSTGLKIGRSEGLGIASFYLFQSGTLGGGKLCSNQAGLAHLTQDQLAKAFQVSEQNPLVGLEGRLQLIHGLAEALKNPKFFVANRPGNIIDYLITSHGRSFSAENVLKAVLDSLGGIWPGRITWQGKNLGDVWRHSKMGEGIDSLLVFHKLSQWLTYSLIEPMLDAGLKVHGVENLTGLAEYRNGGLIIDTDLLQIKDPTLLAKAHGPGEDLILEWRALTIYFLDEIAQRVQTKLGFTPEQFPLAKVLEGGTWWAGRKIASQKRSGGAPPLQLASDGTVF